MDLYISRRNNDLPQRVDGAMHGFADQIKTRLTAAARSARAVVFADRYGAGTPQPGQGLGAPASHISAFNSETRHPLPEDLTPADMGPVLVVAGSLAAGRPIVDYFTELGFEVELTLTLDDAIKSAKTGAVEWSLVAVEIDSLGGICKIADDLLGCRAAACTLPVILLSENFSANDLGQDRLPLCDASLLRSCNCAMLKKGVEAAIENNRAWRCRASQLAAHA